MTNEELKEAIKETNEYIRRCSYYEPELKLYRAHLKSLLDEQRRRACVAEATK